MCIVCVCIYLPIAECNPIVIHIFEHMWSRCKHILCVHYNLLAPFAIIPSGKRGGEGEEGEGEGGGGGRGEGEGGGGRGKGEGGGGRGEVSEQA